LHQLAALIEADLHNSPVPTSLTIFLGDYIDRGPDSAGVLKRLAAGDFPTRFLGLRGNHEQMLLRFLEDAQYLNAWREFGGRETLHSFDIPVADLTEKNFEAIQQRLRELLPREVVDFLHGTRSHYEIESYFFCHAGVRPGVPLGSQRDEDLLWIREEFVNSSADFGKVIVHGHTPVEQPEVRPNRINVDTGAYLTGVLTCLVLEGTSRRFLSTN
jgi:serine/threonine protein phosphatase 1